jgi:hypothetical protein
MSFAAKTSIQSVFVAPNTGQFTACQFDYTALPGITQALVNPFMIIADVFTMMVAVSDPGDHGGRVWTGRAAWELSQGLTFRVVNSGVIMSALSNSPTFDVSGTTGRMRVTPTFSGGTWYTRMDLTIYQG